MKIFALVKYVVKETFSQKIVLLLCAILVVLLFVFIFGFHIVGKNGSVQSISIYGGAPITAEESLHDLPIYAGVYTTFGFLMTVLLSLIATAHIIPESLSNGSMSFFLAKPISRTGILLGIYCGVTLSVAIIQIVFLGSFGILFGIKTGGIEPGFFLCILPLFTAFCSMYALMMLAGIIFRSTGIVNAIALIHIIFFSSVLANRGKIIFPVIHNTVGRSVVDMLYFLLPQVSDLETNAANILSHANVLILPFVFSLLSAAVMMLLSIILFRRLDL
jgi:ABC-type transport system involved in multi-copper enzyme maturation permease subunit